MASNRPSSRTLAAVLLLLAVPLAGCAEAPTEAPAAAAEDLGGTVPDAAADAAADAVGALPAPAHSVARTLVVDAGQLAAEDMAALEDPAEALDSITQASLVVRVAEPGDYVLAYTARDGTAREDALPAMLPGVPHTVRNVDLLTGATLTRDGAVVYERPAADEAWWRMGPIPMGIAFDGDAAATYAYRMDAASEMTLSDLGTDDGSVQLDLARLALTLPVRGRIAWESHDDGAAGQRVAFDAAVRVDEAARDIITFDLAGHFDNESGKLGVTLPALEMWSRGAFSLWAQDGALTAARFDGLSAATDLEVLLWAEDGFAQTLPPAECPNGAPRESPCTILAPPRYEAELQAGPKHDFGAAAAAGFEPDSPQAEAWARVEPIVASVLRQGLVVGDSISVKGELPKTDVSGARGVSFAFEFLLEVADLETLEVAAGSYDALRVAETMHLRFAAEEFAETAYDPETYAMEERVLMRDLALDETLSRTTTWLDARTYQPLKVEISSPLDVDRVLHAIVGSIDAAMWTEAGLPPPADESYRWSVTGLTLVEAERLEGETRFSPGVGLLFGRMLAGATPLAGIAMGGASFDERLAAYVSGENATGDGAAGGGAAHEPIKHLSLASAGALADGKKSYTVTSASDGARWHDFAVTIDGEPLVLARGCSHEPGLVMVCDGSSGEADDGHVQPGDTLRLGGLREGSTLRVLDMNANAVVLSIRVA